MARTWVVSERQAYRFRKEPIKSCWPAMANTMKKKKIRNATSTRLNVGVDRVGESGALGFVYTEMCACERGRRLMHGL